MKKLLQLLTLLIFNFSLSTLHAQSPQAIPYQAVARDNAGNPIANQAVSLRFTIHDATATGTIVYQETQSKTTNPLGLFTANIGEGSVVSGTFLTINWASGSKFMQVEMDAADGFAYTDMGTQQMLSVPYALQALNGLMPGSAIGEMLYWNGSSWVAVAPGTHDQTLTFCNGIPTWGPCLNVAICSQVWMNKNLDVSTYRNGDPIPNVTDPAIWAGLTTGAYCYYNNDSATYAVVYGKLYNWYAVNDPRGLAPIGWHVPSDVE